MYQALLPPTSLTLLGSSSSPPAALYQYSQVPFYDDGDE